MQGLEVFKPLVAALLLPPVPWLLLVLAGWRWRGSRPRVARAAVLLGVALIWLSACAAPARWLHSQLGMDAAPLTPAQIASLQSEVDGPATAVLVLGGGMVIDPDQPQLGELNRHSLERLRVGIRLSRAGGWPLAFSGGQGWAQREGMDDTEAHAAQRSAERDFGHPLTWLEAQSRDTAENAKLSVALLRRQGVGRVLIVTHAWHMPRAQALFTQAASGGMTFVPAPVPGFGATQSPWLEWMPSGEGFEQTRSALRELLGLALVRSQGP